MASVFGHALLAGSIAHVLKGNRKLIGLAVLSAVIPDLDVIAFKFGVPYESMWGHRGITHSILFAVLWAGLLTILFTRSRRLVFFTTILLATGSHTTLDAMTSGGLGVAFFAPFDNARYFFPFRPIKVSPIGIQRFFSEWGWLVVKSELIWIGIPSLVLLLMGRLARRHK